MQIDEILSRFNNVKTCGNGQYVACCPAHDDKKQSLSVGYKDGKILLNCFAGCEARDIVAAVGLQMSDLFEEHHSGAYMPPLKKTKSKPAPKRQDTPCKNIKPCFTHTKEYIYTDEDGAFVAKKIKRYNDDGDKEFSWTHFDSNRQEVSGNGMNGAVMYLYNIAELCAIRDTLAASDKPVYIVEGEKDADTLKEMGLVAVSMPNGASSKWDSNAYNKYFSLLHVVILADNDDAGKASGNKIAAALTGTVKSVKLIFSEAIHEGLKDKGDISDIAAQIGIDGAKEKLLAAESITPVYTPQIESKRTSGKLPMFILEKENRRGDIYYVVDSQLLAEYIRKTVPFYFLKGQNKSAFIFVYDKRKGVYEKCCEDEFKAYIKRPVVDFGVIYATPRAIDEAYKSLKTDDKETRRIAEDELNTDENIINFENGLLYIDTLKLKPHTPKILSTIQIPCRWNVNAPFPEQFDKFINTLANGDKEVIQLLLEFCGAAISNIDMSRPKKALFLVGAGNTGKSKLLSLLAKLIGKENYAAISLNRLERDIHAAFSMWGKRLAGSPDMSFMKVNELETFKSIVGGDDIEFNRKHADSFSGVFKGAMMFCTNSLPKFGGDKGDHVYERMMIVKCDNVIPEEQRDRNLLEKLYAEREGIVQILVMYLRKFLSNGGNFDIPASCKAACEQYKIENDSVLRFLQECTETKAETSKNEPTKAQVYQCFKNWATDSREYIPSKSEFNSIICQKYGVYDISDITVKTHGGNEYYKTFRLSEEAVKKYGC